MQVPYSTVLTGVALSALAEREWHSTLEYRLRRSPGRGRPGSRAGASPRGLGPQQFGCADENSEDLGSEEVAGGTERRTEIGC